MFIHEKFPKSKFSLKLRLYYRVLYWLFAKIPKKLIFPQNCEYNTGHFIDFSTEKSDFFHKMRLYIEHYFEFLPNNPMSFYTKNSQKVHFSSNCTYHTGHFIDFSPKTSDFVLKMRQHIEHYFEFFVQ